MGLVFRATDTILRRPVALKFLATKYSEDPLAKARFFREAQAASALDDPHIGTVFEVGEHDGQLFIAMAYYEGETLQARLRRENQLSLSDVRRLTVQLASALYVAHAAGFVHRDLKPANVMVVPDGRIKLLDFGVAKLVTSAREADLSLTDEGQLLGTIAYMSPEQASGHDVDHRADLFSLGVVMYEMLSGRHPFTADTKVATIGRILNEAPTSLQELRPDAPPALIRLVDKLLSKDPEGRPKSAADVIGALQSEEQNLASATSSVGVLLERWAAVRKSASRPRFGILLGGALCGALIVAALFYRSRGAPGTPADSIAVMPFATTNASPETEYLGDSLTSELISSLSKLPELKVISRTAVARYGGKEIEPYAVGRDLGVRMILIGKIRHDENMLTIDAELVDTSTGRQLWGRHQRHDLSEISQIRKQLVTEIAQHLRVRLTGEERARLARPSTDNADAYPLYLKGRYYLNSRLNADKGRDFFERAIEKDPMYALAYAGLADTYASPVGVRALLPPDLANRRAKAAAEKAIEIDPSLGQAYVAIGNASLTYDWDWTAAERHYRRAIELDPTDSNARHRYSHLLIAMGRFDESLVESQKAIEIDPLDPNLLAHLGFHYKTARQPERAIEICLQAIKLNPNARVGYFYLAEAYVQKGMTAEALALIEGMPDAVKKEIASTPGVTGFGHVYGAAGKTTEARAAIDTLKAVSKLKTNATYRLARNHAALGEIDEAFAWLEQAYQDRAPVLMDLEVDPVLDPLRSDPRFDALARRAGFRR
jgi:TolB-like protein/tetratricopeptide (TPR) repeat protein